MEIHDDGSSLHGTEEAFEEVYFLMCYMAILWVISKVFARIGLPGLIGEIFVGIILGPNLIDFVPYHDALIVIGEIGVLLLVLEAGIDVDIGMLKVIGKPGVGVALLGSMTPLLIGAFIAYFIAQNTGSDRLITCISIGACLAPTSMGIALNVLRSGKCLNTPTGRLIIAAAILDDVIVLMLLSILEALGKNNFEWYDIVKPLVVSPILIIIFGVLSVKVVPPILKKIISEFTGKITLSVL